MNKIKPNFFIIGCPRCGTTSLHYYLKQHPDIDWQQLERHISELEEAVAKFDDEKISKLFAQLVPEGSFIQGEVSNVIPIKGKG